VKGLKNEMEAAIKRRGKRADQSAVEMDRAMGTERVIRLAARPWLWHMPNAVPFGLCRHCTCLLCDHDRIPQSCSLPLFISGRRDTVHVLDLDPTLLQSAAAAVHNLHLH
jgi:hypothetical protein